MNFPSYVNIIVIDAVAVLARTGVHNCETFKIQCRQDMRPHCLQYRFWIIKKQHKEKGLKL